MGILILLVPLTLLLSGGGALAYWWASRHRQFEDLDTPAYRILFDDEIDDFNEATKNEDGKVHHEC